MKKIMFYGIPVLLGILFCFDYLRLAAGNVVYSDYIRLINAYLPDVGNPAKFFVPDILTRVPITYLARLVNVRFWGYNTMFDMSLGVLSLGIGGAALAFYAHKEKKISLVWYLIVIFLYFGLNKWEMLTNGTGWVCFLSISGFYWHYVILDRAVKTGHANKTDRILLFLLPPVLTLLVAGPYCGSYSALLTLVYVVMLAADFKKNKKLNLLYSGYLLAVLIPLFLYLWSNSTAVYVHRGAVEGSIIETFLSEPVFFVKFMLKAFASVLLGMNQLTSLAEGGIPGGYTFVYLLGAFMIVLYLLGLFFTWKYKIYQETSLPLLLILNGGLNHLLILISRWIFLKDSYGMSSRYSIQYQMGLIGILWTFAIVWGMRRKIAGGKESESEVPVNEKSFKRMTIPSAYMAMIFLGTAVVLTGSVYTTLQEMETAPYRKAYLEMNSRYTGLNYRTASDEELEEYLHHDPDEIRKAMQILEENNLNIFRK